MSGLKFVDSKTFKKNSGDGGFLGVRKQYSSEVKAPQEKDSNSRILKFTISTDAVDRDRDTINPKGFNLDAFRKSPTVLFAHDNSRPPVARALDIDVEDNKLKATAEFMDNNIDTSGFSDMIFRMLKGGFLNATSVGFIPVEFEFAPEDDTKRAGGVDYKSVELLEFSVVPVPANPEALIEARSKGIDTHPLEGWFEEALDNWMDFKDMLLVPRKSVEELYKVTKTTKKTPAQTFTLTPEQRKELLEKNLENIRKQNLKQTVDTATEDSVTEQDKLEIESVDKIEKTVETKEADKEVVCKNTRFLSHVASRIYNTPLLIHQPKLAGIMHVLGERVGLTETNLDCFIDDDLDLETRDSVPYSVDEDGIATIPVMGTLVKRGGFMEAMSGMKSYEQIENDFNHAIENEKVKAISLLIDSPGGEASGCMELSDAIYNARGKKPIWAIVDDSAYSAAYAIASAADRIVMSRTGGVGSIGVVCCHVDYSVAAHNQGVDFTFIYAGDRKIDGNDVQPLSDEARKRIQGDIDKHYDLFVKTVARNRGITEEEVKETKAQTYMGDTSLEVKLADSVESRKSAIEKMKNLIKEAVTKQEDSENFVVQSLIFPKTHWEDSEAVESWASENGFSSEMPEETESGYKLHQVNSDEFEELRTVCFQPSEVSADDPDCMVQAVGGTRTVKEVETPSVEKKSEFKTLTKRMNDHEATIMEIYKKLNKLEKQVNTTEQVVNNTVNTNMDSNDESLTDDAVSEVLAGLTEIIDETVKSKLNKLTGRLD